MSNYFQISGYAEGTTYSIIYNDVKGRNLKEQIESFLNEIEKSLSVYDPNSLISRINRNEVTLVDNYFYDVFHKAKELNARTKGIFDISAEPLFKAWGFSFQNREIMDDAKIRCLLNQVGMEKIDIIDRHIVKSDPHVVLNMNAIAKGYSVDVIASYLESVDIHDYLIEIGGEIRLKGVNKKGDKWIIAVDKPVYGNHIPGQQIQTYLQLTDKAIATSGEYRRFYIDENGNRLSHTIDTRTGYPVKHNLRSVTVITDNSMTADAYATAFMVIGLEESRMFLSGNNELGVILIYEEDKTFKMEYSDNIGEYFIK